MYAFIQDVPGDSTTYARIDAAMGLDRHQPIPGLVAHVVIEQPEGLRYVDVWESEPDWARFRDLTLIPAVEQVLDEMGIPHDTSKVRIEEIHVIDAVTNALVGTPT